MFGKKPKFPFPDLGDMSFGEAIAELEKQGLMGHFKDIFCFPHSMRMGKDCVLREIIGVWQELTQLKYIKSIWEMEKL